MFGRVDPQHTKERLISLLARNYSLCAVSGWGSPGGAGSGRQGIVQHHGELQRYTLRKDDNGAAAVFQNHCGFTKVEKDGDAHKPPAEEGRCSVLRMSPDLHTPNGGKRTSSDRGEREREGGRERREREREKVGYRAVIHGAYHRAAVPYVFSSTMHFGIALWNIALNLYSPGVKIPPVATMLPSSRWVKKPVTSGVSSGRVYKGPVEKEQMDVSVNLRLHSVDLICPSEEKSREHLIKSASELKPHFDQKYRELFVPGRRPWDFKLATIKSESRLKHLLQRLPSYCPESMNELWMCINSTLPGVSRKSDGWVGLGCCELAISSECRRECRQASSKNDITKVCKKVTENSLYSCITKNEMGSTCCGYAGRHTTCREYCQAIFRTDSTPTVSQITAVKEYCQSHSAQLLSCVSNFTKSYPIRSPIDSLYCCDRAEATHCQVACRRILRTMSTEHEIMEGLIDECRSQPLPQEPMWQCFLGSAHPPSPPEEETPHPAKMDCAKLHCCAKANTSLCRDMCQEISTNWGSQTWQDFDQLCEYNPVEAELINCLADVREPCQLGCKDLAYCTNFNNRPTELFRSCNVQSDQGAMNDIKLWSNGTIKMPFMNIPVLDIRKCLPDMWKAVACSLQIKPCHSKFRGSVICKSDCVDILTQCGDRKRFHEGQTPERICELLSPIDDPERCIPLHRYLTPSALGNNVVEEVIHPCNPNPCPSNHLCQVNRKGCLDELNCQPYLCVPGCKLGEASEFLVQQDARIQVPTRAGPAGCYEVCSCGPSGRLENCVETPCVDINKPCVVGGQRKIGCRKAQELANIYDTKAVL
ncbi:hypothetical protein F2P81_019456 [Scophthalmus maximus]|uniref:Reversion-inducing cysteine-rich protein with Kazal motifs n=1 Tax=Scophthalmus maximus TaxID=52904 RepID=A0A6A4S746_SCOMX|nr:hypothetical protein F2P81_019456 [Scophthalmus maximus]